MRGAKLLFGGVTPAQSAPFTMKNKLRKMYGGEKQGIGDDARYPSVTAAQTLGLRFPSAAPFLRWRGRIHTAPQSRRGSFGFAKEIMPCRILRDVGEYPARAPSTRMVYRGYSAPRAKRPLMSRVLETIIRTHGQIQRGPFSRPAFVPPAPDGCAPRRRSVSQRRSWRAPARSGRAPAGRIENARGHIDDDSEDRSWGGFPTCDGSEKGLIGARRERWRRRACPARRRRNRANRDKR